MGKAGLLVSRSLIFVAVLMSSPILLPFIEYHICDLLSFNSVYDIADQRLN